jgi:spore coat polysaccharide biosynthesis protein SpsF
MISKKVVLIIQARMGSTRLPGKSMMDLAGAPLVGRILERVKRCKNIHQIVLAIPNLKEDHVLIDLAERYAVSCFAGSERNLVDRYYDAAVWSEASIIVRLPADNATPEPEEIDRIVDFHLSLECRGFTSNLSSINNSGYPDGIGAEVFDFSLLQDVKKRGNSSIEQLEHLHLNFYDYSLGKEINKNWCPVNTVICPVEFRRPDLILDVNTLSQYHFMLELYTYLYPKNPNFHITDTIKWYDKVYLKELNYRN